MNFSRPEILDVYVEIDVETGIGYDSDEATVAHFVEQSNALMAIGTTARVRQLDSLVWALPGIVDVTGFRIGTSASPVGTTNVTVSPRGLIRFDTSRTVVNS
jgi:hypothetical protein